MKHALLSPSAAKQWIGCPPSIRFSEALPEPPASEDTLTGTLAHSIAEARLKRLLGHGTAFACESKLKVLRADTLYFPAMEEYLDTYTDYVMERILSARARCRDPEILLEARLRFGDWAPEGSGIGDVVIVADGVLEVIDLKFGQGVPVDAAENPQLRLYGLGAYQELGMLYDLQEVTTHIVQPRLDSITTETLSLEELLRWAEEVVRPAALLAYAGEGVFQAGEHCRWCKAKNVCRAHAAWHLELARHDFQEPAELSDEEIAEILSKAEALAKWAKRVKDYALEQALHHNRQWPGWKLVSGRANRKITDEQKAMAALVRAGYPMEKICKLRGLGDLEDEVGPKRLPEALGELLVKPEGKPTLAPEQDKRPALRSTAQDDFSAQYMEEDI